MLLPIEFDILVIHIIIIKNEYFEIIRLAFIHSRFGLTIELLLEIVDILVHLVLE